MTKRVLLYLCLLTTMLSACQSEHERQTALLHELLDACERYDTMPNDSAARAVLYYMERHGEPRELQQAWRLMAKMYKRHGALFGEDFAYQMAMDCVDSTSTDRDTLAVMALLGEWSMNQYYSLDEYRAQDMARRARRMAEAIGDSTAYYQYMGLEAYVYVMSFQKDYAEPYADVSFRKPLADAHTASRRLWQLGRKDLAVEAFLPVIACHNRGAMADSVAYWLSQYARYTRQDIRNAESLPAVEYFLQKGDYFMYGGLLDSALCYYQKVINQSKNYVKGIAYGRMLDLYNKFDREDSTHHYRVLYNDHFISNYFSVKKDKFLENEDEWRQRNAFIAHELALQRRSTLQVCGIAVLLLLLAFIAYRYYMLRTHHRDTLEQNREYADLLRSLKQRTQPGILDTDIARRFHDLSAQDSHPTAADWQALHNEIDRQHPHLFATLQQLYAEHQPDQTLTEQERHVVCLIAIRCSPLQMSVLLVCTKSNVSNLRRRLYHKLTGHDGSGSYLDRYVAGMCG